MNGPTLSRSPRRTRGMLLVGIAVAAVTMSGCVPLPSQIPFLPTTFPPTTPATPTPTTPTTTAPPTGTDWLDDTLPWPSTIPAPVQPDVGPAGIGPLWSGLPPVAENGGDPDAPATTVAAPTTGAPIVSTTLPWDDSNLGLIMDPPGDTQTGGNLLSTSVGRLFSSYQDSSWTCTATVINSETNNILVTAAHCVIDEETGMPADDVTFHPGYAGSNDPFGEWTAEEVYWNPDYVTSLPEPIEGEWGMYADFAFIRMAPNAAGQEIEEVTGGQGISFTGESNGLLSIGYAAESPYNGRFPRACVDNDPVFGTNLFPHLVLDCNMTGGASGGPILTNVDPTTGAGTIVAVNSFGGSTTLGGPPLGATALGLLQNAVADS